MNDTNQKNIEIGGSNNKVTGGDDNSIVNNNTYQTNQKKLGSLFKRLSEKYKNDETICQVSDDLKRYVTIRDTEGIEKKLRDANKEHLVEDYTWLKQEFYKKLVKYQNYEPAQEIFSIILAIVLEKYRNIVRPKIISGETEAIVLTCLSEEVINPILELIHEEGCDDIMQLTSTEIEGMFHYLTGNCHIKWTA